jgi:hypothetical protein
MHPPFESPSPMTQTAVAYGRKSFDDPDDRTASVADQRLFAERYAERHELELIAFHGDDGLACATCWQRSPAAVSASSSSRMSTA